VQVGGTASSVIRSIGERYNLDSTFTSSGLVKSLDNSSCFISKPPAFTNYLSRLADQFLKPNRQKLFMIRNTLPHFSHPMRDMKAKSNVAAVPGGSVTPLNEHFGLAPNCGSRAHIGDTQNVLMNR